MVEIRALTAAEARRYRSELAEILVDCVEGGASVSFMLPFSKGEAEGFFDGVVRGLESGSRILLVAFEGADLAGTVQILTAMPPNQPHRAEIAKLLVRRTARGKGIGTSLMKAAEEHATSAGKTLLILDTATGGDAERLYHRLNWTQAAVIPNYAMLPDGQWCATTIFWKFIS
jgi:GNAT superfamily N-acetyltransferase